MFQKVFYSFKKGMDICPYDEDQDYDYDKALPPVRQAYLYMVLTHDDGIYVMYASSCIYGFDLKRTRFGVVSVAS